MAWLRQEPGAKFVARLVDDVRDGSVQAAISAINLGEVYYTLVRAHGFAHAEETLIDFLDLPWEVVSATDERVIDAARLKAQFAISYADSFALGLARERDAALITDDPELRDCDHGVDVAWEVGE